MPRSTHFSASSIGPSIALALAVGITPACATQDSSSQDQSKKTVARSVRITQPDEKRVTEIRIEKKIIDGDQDITLVINGEEFHPANDEELTKLLREHGAGNLMFHHQDDDDVSIHAIAPTLRDGHLELKMENLNHGLELTDLSRLDLDDATDQLHGLIIGGVKDLDDELIIALEPPHNMGFELLDDVDISDFNFTPPKSMLGVQLAPVSEDLAAYLDLDAAQCVRVESVIDDSPAAKAGLKSNDIIAGIKTPDESMRHVGLEEFRSIVGQSEPGTNITLAVLRKDGQKEIEVELGHWNNDLMQTDFEFHPADPESDDMDPAFHNVPQPRVQGRPNVFLRRSPKAPRRDGSRGANVPFPDDLQRQIEEMRGQLEDQMKQMKQMMEELHRTQKELQERPRHTQPEA